MSFAPLDWRTPKTIAQKLDGGWLLTPAELRLAGAAPELLAVVRLIAAVPHSEALYEICKAGDCVGCMARAALAKAEGRAP